MVITVQEMRILEANTIGLGIPLRMLMEAAGKSVADTVIEEIKSRKLERDLEIVVLMGKGGNGGDGVVAARYLASRGYSVTIVPSHSLKEVEHPDTKANLDIVLRMSNSVQITKPVRLEVIRDADIIIDGLLGTGVKGELRDPIKSMVEEANKAKSILRVAIDTPTGLNPDTGDIHGIAFKADVTVTMHDVKPGLLKKPEYTGRIVVANIGIPPESKLYIGPGDAIYGVPRKPRDAHKGMGGRVLVIGGSKYYTGAPALAGAAALAVGADLSFIVVPEYIKSVVSSYTPELIVVSVPGDHFIPDHISYIEKYIEYFRPHAIVFGNGLSREEDTIEFAKEFIEVVTSKYKELFLVIDADGLKGIKYGETKFSWNTVITPHRGEFKALTNTRVENVFKDIDYIVEASRVLEATILLKAPIDAIVRADTYRFNRTGNEDMSIGGTGDVLAGLVGALLAKTRDTFKAAAIAAYLNGLAGDYLYYVEKENVSPAKMIEILPRISKNPLDYHLRIYGLSDSTI